MTKSSKMQICDLIAGFGQYITNDYEGLMFKIINNIHKMFIWKYDVYIKWYHKSEHILLSNEILLSKNRLDKNIWNHGLLDWFLVLFFHVWFICTYLENTLEY